MCVAEGEEYITPYVKGVVSCIESILSDDDVRLAVERKASGGSNGPCKEAAYGTCRHLTLWSDRRTLSAASEYSRVSSAWCGTAFSGGIGCPGYERSYLQMPW